MIFRIFITFFSIIIFSSIAHSQKFQSGMVLGISGNQIDGDTQEGYDKAGALAGLFTELPLTQKLSLSAGLEYFGKGAVKKYEDSNGNSFEEFKTVLHYVDVPVLLHYAIVEKFIVSGGFSPGYLFAEKIYSGGFEVDKSYYDMNAFDLSFRFSVGFRFSRRWEFGFSHCMSLTTIRNDNENWKNRNLAAVLKFRFGGNK